MKFYHGFTSIEAMKQCVKFSVPPDFKKPGTYGNGFYLTSDSSVAMDYTENSDGSYSFGRVFEFHVDLNRILITPWNTFVNNLFGSNYERNIRAQLLGPESDNWADTEKYVKDKGYAGIWLIADDYDEMVVYDTTILVPVEPYKRVSDGT